MANAKKLDRIASSTRLLMFALDQFVGPQSIWVFRGRRLPAAHHSFIWTRAAGSRSASLCETKFGASADHQLETRLSHASLGTIVRIGQYEG